MSKNRRITAMVLAGVLGASLCACGSGAGTAGTTAAAGAGTAAETMRR